MRGMHLRGRRAPGRFFNMLENFPPSVKRQAAVLLAIILWTAEEEGGERDTHIEREGRRGESGRGSEWERKPRKGKEKKIGREEDGERERERERERHTQGRKQLVKQQWKRIKNGRIV